jgi:hypothetical protein
VGTRPGRSPRDDRVAGLREEVEALGHRKASRSRGGRARKLPRAARETLSVDVVEYDVVSEAVHSSVVRTPSERDRMSNASCRIRAHVDRMTGVTLVTVRPTACGLLFRWTGGGSPPNRQDGETHSVSLEFTRECQQTSYSSGVARCEPHRLVKEQLELNLVFNRAPTYAEMRNLGLELA